MANTSMLLCEGDTRKPGCGERIAAFDRGTVCPVAGATILSFDRLGRARLLCVCGAVTMTRGQTAKVG